jgi:hypothetical protein
LAGGGLKFTHKGITTKHEGSIDTMFLTSDISSKLQLVRKRREDQFIMFPWIFKKNEGFDLQSYNVQVYTRYFEMF